MAEHNSAATAAMTTADTDTSVQSIAAARCSEEAHARRPGTRALEAGQPVVMHVGGGDALLWSMPLHVCRATK